MNIVNERRLLEHLKKHQIIQKYQLIFDKYFKEELLLKISDSEINEIICDNEYKSVVRLYEIVNDTKINDDILNNIYSLDDFEIIRYCLRLSISNDFDDDNKKYEYLKALSKSNSEVVRYAYGVASSKQFIDKIDGIKYVKMIGNCNDDIALILMYFLHNNNIMNREDAYQITSLIAQCNDEEKVYKAYIITLDEDSITSDNFYELIKNVIDKNQTNEDKIKVKSL